MYKCSMDFPLKPGKAVSPEAALLEQSWVWGVPFSPLTFEQTLTAINSLIRDGSPHFAVTANLHYAMLCASDPRLRSHNDKATLILADGMPIVWASRWRTRPLPERVTGADLFPALCELAAANGYRVFLLGAGPGVAEIAASNLVARFPALQIVGVACPPFRDLSVEEHGALQEQIRAAKPHMLFVAFGQPKGELWVSDNYQALGVPVVIQVGASIDFAAGNIRRAPRWMQRIGLEWVYRLMLEPRRLIGRYSANAWFALRMIARDSLTKKSDRR